MNVKMELIWIADRLDRAGMTAEANGVDSIIKFAQEAHDEIWTDRPINSVDEADDSGNETVEELAAQVATLKKQLHEAKEKIKLCFGPARGGSTRVG